MEVSVGEHWIGHIFGLEVHMDTLITMWITMGILILLALIIRKNLSIVPNKMQAIAESVMGFFWGLVEPMGKDGRKHIPLLATLFLFILTANLIGQIPWRIYHIHAGGEFASPTNDINMTAAMALIVLFYYIGAGVVKKGPKYFLHYFKPLPVLAPLNILEDVVRPLSLSVRLFANILAGEILIMVFLGLGAKVFHFLAHMLGPVGKIGIIGILAPLPFMFFEIFVAVIQALVFTLLSAAYLTIATQDNH